MTEENKVALQDLLNDFGVMTYEIDNCKRQIMAWIRIGEEVTVNKDSEINNFCGWCQDALNRLVVIDAYKIYKHTKVYITEILQKSAYASNIDQLIQKSELKHKITVLGKIIEPLRNFRNKRFAHIEIFTLERTTLHLIELSAALTDLNNSISFIMHYVSNPHFLQSIGDESKVYFTLCKSEATLEALEHQLKNDRVVRIMNKIRFSSNISKAPILPDINVGLFEKIKRYFRRYFYD